MKNSDLMILGAAAVAAYLITRGKLKLPTMTGAPMRPSNAVNLQDATGSTMNTDWVIPNSQQADMLNAQWPSQ